MTLNLGPDLEAALKDLSRQQGTLPEALALKALRERFLPVVRQIQPRDEWERSLLAAASDCGVSLSNDAVSSEGLYE